MKVTLQSIFQQSFDAYASDHKLALKQHKAAHAIKTCRTVEQGGHVQRCPDGHEEHIQYHSCRHRSCPQCNGFPKEQWIQKQHQRLLTTNHYHVIFTLPHELLSLWQYNTRWFTQALFKVVSDTLLTLSKDKKHLGGTPGLLLSLHTWGRNLSLHPHIHCLITGGALTTDGQWQVARNNYLFPSRVVRALYQGKLLSAIERGLRSDLLTIPPLTNRVQLTKCLRQLYQKKWNVRIQPPYAHGKGVLSYLSRYVKGGPLSNRRLTSANEDHVDFRYTDHRDGKTKTLSLDTSHFLDRLLDHIPEPRQHVIRHYGLYGHQANKKRQQARACLGQAEPESIVEMDWQDYVQQFSKGDGGLCKQCGKPLVRGCQLVKNSYSKVPGSGYVQQSVGLDRATWYLPPTKPPDGRGDIFLSQARPIN